MIEFDSRKTRRLSVLTASTTGNATLAPGVKTVMPLTKPAVPTPTLFAFTGHRGAYIRSLIVQNSDRQGTLSLAVPCSSGQHFSLQNFINRVSPLAIASVLVLFLMTRFQRVCRTRASRAHVADA